MQSLEKDRHALLCSTGSTSCQVKVPFLEVGVVLRVVLVAGLLQGVVEVVAILLIDVDGRQVRASSEPPLLGA